MRDWARSDELVCPYAVEETVRRLMASAEGDEIRERVEKLTHLVKQ